MNTSYLINMAITITVRLSYEYNKHYWCGLVGSYVRKGRRNNLSVFCQNLSMAIIKTKCFTETIIWRVT